MTNNQLLLCPAAALELLRATRTLTVTAVSFLSVQLFGNLYEQIVTNIRQIVDPTPGVLVDEFAPGSPVFYYMPWVLIGIAALIAVWRRAGSYRAAGLLHWSLAALVIGLVAKVALVTLVNPSFRDLNVSPDRVGDTAVLWAIGNLVAILAVGSSIGLILRWRLRLAEIVFAELGPTTTV